MKLEEQWVEVFALLFMALGFFLSVAFTSSLFSYISVFLGGFIAARLYYLKRYKEPIFPFILIIVGFLVGYLIGGFFNSRVLILIFFIFGFFLSYYLHMKEILVIFKNEEFIK